MIFGIGTDIVQINRMQENLDKIGERFAQRILSDQEYLEFLEHPSKSAFLSKRFAAKEATVKAFGTGFRNGISMKHIQVEHDELGKPILVFSAAAKAVAEQNNIARSHISIADEKEFAVAYVVLESH